MKSPLAFADVKFVPHDGSSQPVDDMIRVIPVFRFDRDAEHAFSEAGGSFLEAHAYRDAWTHAGIGSDIVAYAVDPRMVATGQEGGEPFPQPQRKDGGIPCGECRLQAGETCDICGAIARIPGLDDWLKQSPQFHPGDLA